MCRFQLIDFYHFFIVATGALPTLPLRSRNRRRLSKISQVQFLAFIQSTQKTDIRTNCDYPDQSPINFLSNIHTTLAPISPRLVPNISYKMCRFLQIDFYHEYFSTGILPSLALWSRNRRWRLSKRCIKTQHTKDKYQDEKHFNFQTEDDIQRARC